MNTAILAHDTGQKTESITSTRFLYLDSIRGLAALSVVGSHYVGAYGIPFAEDVFRYSPLHILFDGAAAVSLFFVLSGFVLSFKYLHPGKNGTIPDIHYAGYVASRICRIWIPLVAVLLLSALAQRLAPIPMGGIDQSQWASKFWTVQSDVTHLIKQALFSRQELTMQLIPQDWTLRYELILSLMMPVAVLLAVRHTLWLIGATLYAVIVLHVSPFAFHFMIGAILAKHYYQITEWLKCRDRARITILSVGLLLYTFQFTVPHYLQWELKESVIYLITGAGSSLLLVFVFVSPSTQRALLHPAIHYVGTVSYSVYLSHMIILLSVAPLLLSAVSYGHWTTGLIATILFTVALSSVLYRFVEIPSIEAGRKLSLALRRLP